MPRFTRRAIAGLVVAGAAVPAARLGASNSKDDLYQLTQPSAISRPIGARLSDEVFVTDFGAISGQDVVESMERALRSFSADRPGVLVVPPGDWRISMSVDWSQYDYVTLRIEPGAIFRHGKNRVILPPYIETGTVPQRNFVGTGELRAREPKAINYERLPKGWVAYPNFAVGIRALAANVSGTNNLAWGNNVLKSNKSGCCNIGIGNDALIAVAGGSYPAEGSATGYGWNNIAIGDTALRDCTSGYENLAIGTFNLQQRTTGRWNLAVGHASQILGTDGECNISLGAYTLVTNFGSNSLAIGWAALEAQVTGSNIAIGHVAMNANVSGNLNTAIGSEALMRLKTGNYNVCMGLGTLTNLVTGDNNTAIGTYALSSARGNATNNTAVGRDALLLLTTGNDNTAIGSGALATLQQWDNCTGLGTSAAVTGSNQVQLGNSKAVPHAFAPLQLRSDARDKADIRDTRLGLAFIKALRPVDFRWNLREDYGPSPDTAEVTPQRHKRQRFHHGLLAQEVREVIKDTGIDFGGYQDHTLGGGGDVLSLGYEELIAPLIKAVQELSTEVETLRKEVARLRSRKDISAT